MVTNCLSCRFVYKRANLHTNLCLFQLMTGLVRIKSPWKQLLVLFLVFSPQLLLLVISLFSTAEINIDTSTPEALAGLKGAQAFSTIAFFLLPAFLYSVFCFRMRYGYYLGLTKPQLPNMYVLAVIVIIFSFPVVFWLGMLNEKIHLPEWMTSLEKDSAAQMEAILKVNNPFDLIVNIIVIGLLPAFCEEIFFRGAMQRVMIHVTKSAWAGIIITAILFSALHLQFMGFLPRMFMGVVMGVLYWYSGSLWTSVIAHFVYNAIQVVAVAYAPKLTSNNPEVPLLAGIASGVAVWAVLWYYRKQSTITYAKVYRTEDYEPHKNFMT
jgi:membrane protease YdiL (CAAX protease family)